jgi:hypothetical protein
VKSRDFPIFALGAAGAVVAIGCASEPAAPSTKPAAAPVTTQATIDPMIDLAVKTDLNRNCLGTDDAGR